MNKMVMVILISLQLSGMQELQNAIRNSDVKKVTELIKNSKAAPRRTARSRLIHDRPIDLKQAHELAQTLLTEKEQRSKSLNNPHVYKRIFISLGTIATSWVPMGICTYDAFASGNWPSGERVWPALAAGVAGTYHGIDQMQLALTNEDAINNHAKHLAILSHISRATNEEAQPEEA